MSIPTETLVKKLSIVLPNTSMPGEETCIVWYNRVTGNVLGAGSSNPCPKNHDVVSACVYWDKRTRMPLPELAPSSESYPGTIHTTLRQIKRAYDSVRHPKSDELTQTRLL